MWLDAVDLSRFGGIPSMVLCRSPSVFAGSLASGSASFYSVYLFVCERERMWGGGEDNPLPVQSPQLPEQDQLPAFGADPRR